MSLAIDIHNDINFILTKQYIDSIDFSRIINKLVNHYGWIKNDAEKTCEQYRNFLFLNKKYGDQYKSLPPSEDIDEFWHNHILDTQAYEKDCHMIFGKILHHYPYLGIDDKSDMNYLNSAFEITQKLFLHEFGYEIEPTKSSYPQWVYKILKKFT